MTPDAFITPEQKVLDAELQPRASVGMLDDGTWAIVGQNLSLDGIFDLQEPEGDVSHTFAVVAEHDWGATLMKLDNRPAARGFAGVIATSTGVCRDVQCVDAAPHGTWFDVFSTREGRPERRIGRLRAKDPMSATWIASSDAWVAVSAGVGRPRPQGVVALDGCPVPSSIAAVEVPFPADDPLSVESLAFERGVDAFLKCDTQGVTVAIPNLLRGPLPARDPRLQIHPVIAARPWTLPESSEDVAAWAVALGLGDVDTAALLQSKWYAATPRLGLEAAEIAIAAGRPDEAMGAAWQATKTAWNRDNDFFWVYARARVASQTRDDGAFEEMWQRLPGMVQKLEDTRVYAWFVLQAFDVDFASSEQPNYKIVDDGLGGDAFASHRRAARLLRAVRTRDPAALRAYRELADAHAFEATPLTDGLPADVYGRRALADSSADYARVGRATWQPGWAGATGLNGLYVSAARSGDVAPASVKTLLSCDADGFRVEPGLGIPSDVIWALGAGRQAACKSPTQLLEALPEAPSKSFDMALLELSMRGTFDLSTLAEVARYAAEERLSGACVGWNLAAAISWVAADDLVSAERHVAWAQSCSGQAHRHDAARVAAIVGWMKSGVVSRDFAASVQDEVAAIVGQHVAGCALEAPMTVDVTRALPAELAAWVRPAPTPTTVDELSLVSAPQHIRLGANDIRAMEDLVKSRDVEAAWSTLESARVHFDRAGFLPGQMRAAALRQALFPAGPPDASAVKTIERARAGIWAGKPQAELELLASSLLTGASLSNPPKAFCERPRREASEGPIDLDALP